MRRAERIEQQIRAAFDCTVLEINNESAMHQVPVNSETHFHVLLVSEHFKALTAVGRHKTVMGLLKAEFESGLHALRLNVYTPIEWQARAKQSPAAPQCRGGGKA